MKRTERFASVCRKNNFRHAKETVENVSECRFSGFVAVQRYGRVPKGGKQLRTPDQIGRSSLT